MNIVKVIASGLLTSAATIARNSVVIVACAPENAPVLDLTQNGISDSIQNTQNINITCGGAASVGYIVLRKVAGWSSKIEEPFFGAYDNRSVVGS